MTFSLLDGTRAVLAIAGVMFLTGAPALAQTTLAAPPRSNNDINSGLDQAKANPTRAAQARNFPAAQPDASLDPRAQAQVYYRRAGARAALGRNREAIADLEQAITIGNQVMAGIQRPQQANQYYFAEISRYEQTLSVQ